MQTIKGSAVARKTRTWKTLKQIIATERSLQWTADTALCELLGLLILILLFLFFAVVSKKFVHIHSLMQIIEIIQQ